MEDLILFLFLSSMPPEERKQVFLAMKDTFFKELEEHIPKDRQNGFLSHYFETKCKTCPFAGECLIADKLKAVQMN